MTRTLKWGTVWACIWNGIETVHGQSWKFVFLSWPCIVSMPVEIQAHTVALFKAPVNGKVKKWEVEHDGTFT